MTDWSWYGEALFWFGLMGAVAALLWRSPLVACGFGLIAAVGAVVALSFD